MGMINLQFHLQGEDGAIRLDFWHTMRDDVR